MSEITSLVTAEAVKE
ncbi:hypothetical protein ECEC1737_2856, partial [Escherichia coli EC1737]